MTTQSERHLKTGGDPRTLADHAALRDEMNKLTLRYARTSTGRTAKTLCLWLFEHNGVELQIYTLMIFPWA